MYFSQIATKIYRDGRGGGLQSDAWRESLLRKNRGNYQFLNDEGWNLLIRKWEIPRMRPTLKEFNFLIKEKLPDA